MGNKHDIIGLDDFATESSLKFGYIFLGKPGNGSFGWNHRDDRSNRKNGGLSKIKLDSIPVAWAWQLNRRRPPGLWGNLGQAYGTQGSKANMPFEF